jgi:hypothetical protein
MSVFEPSSVWNTWRPAKACRSLGSLALPGQPQYFATAWSAAKMPAHFSSSRRRLGEGGKRFRLFHFVREHRFFNGRKHFINVLASHDHDRYENLFFYLLTLQMLKESFSGANPH